MYLARLISDNILVAYECLHYMKTNRTKKNSFCALKLDMTKAYDRVEWNFLEAMMLGFHDQWVRTIMKCVTSVSYSIILTGSIWIFFEPSHGIRQGDPISPYLFLLCAEALTCCLKKEEANKRLQGVQITTTAPIISHLLFADDSLLLFKATSVCADVVSRVLTNYCAASGQLVNFSKSCIFFSKKCDMAIREDIKRKVGMTNESITDRYLGLPTDVGRAKEGKFKYLKDRVWKRVQGWMEKTLSVGGKEVLIKSTRKVARANARACILFCFRNSSNKIS